LLASDWYRARLAAKQAVDKALWTRHVNSLEDFQREGAIGIDVPTLLAEARRQQARVHAPEYLEELVGTIGADPSHGR
jgi:hypothetical protein